MLILEIPRGFEIGAARAFARAVVINAVDCGVERELLVGSMPR